MYRKHIKGFIDFVISLIVLIVISPIFFTILIYLTIANRGAPFFYQVRPGKNERLFKIIKFKSMNDKVDKDGRLLSDSQRLTKMGAFIRKTSLDEMPQLLNVLKGDMSLIGPRPLLPRYLPYYSDREKMRHLVKPGITGLAQVNGRNHLNWDERLEMDVKYVQNITFKNDAIILWQTLLSVIKRKDILVIPGEKYTTLDNYRNFNAKN